MTRQHNPLYEWIKVVNTIEPPHHFGAAVCLRSPSDIFKSCSEQSLQQVSARVYALRAAPLPDLNWSLTPTADRCSEKIHHAWQTQQTAAMNHPLFHSLISTPEHKCLQTLRSIMLFFTKRSYALYGFNLHELAAECETASLEAFKKIRSLFSSHHALFVHDWHALHMDDALTSRGVSFLNAAVFDDALSAPEVTALDELKREAQQSVTSPEMGIWCYLSMYGIASAMTTATKKLCAQYESRYPNNQALAYLGGQFHLLYDEIDKQYNQAELIDDLFGHDIDEQQENMIIRLLELSHQFGMAQWDALYQFIQDESLAKDLFEIQNDYLHQDLNLPDVIDTMLYEEQILHAKNIEFPWPDDKSVFAGQLSAYYHPEFRPLFALPYYLIPLEQADYHGFEDLDESLNHNLCIEIDKKIYYRLFVHPMAVAHYAPLSAAGFHFIDDTETEYLATPTSSYRSLLTWRRSYSNDPMQFFISKLSIDKVIFAENRVNTENTLIRSQILESLFRALGDDRLKEYGFIPFPEVATLIPKLKSANLGGQIIREIPQSVLRGERRFIPLQSLVSPEKEGEPLLLEVIQQSGLSSREFIKRIFIDTYMKSLMHLSFERGIGFHAHLQNLSLETLPNLMPTGNLVHRDYSDMPVDITTMIAKDIPFHHIAQFSKLNFQSNFYGFHVYTHCYMYKILSFMNLLKVLVQYAPDFTQSDADELESELDAQFLNLLKQHTRQSYTMNDLVKGADYDDERRHYEFIGRKISIKAFETVKQGKRLPLSPKLIAIVSKAIKEKQWWHFDEYDLARIPDDIPPKFYLSLYEFYEYDNILYAKNDKNRFAGFMFHSDINTSISHAGKGAGLFHP